MKVLNYKYYLASSVSLTNTLAEISKNIGANWKEIIPTLQSDKRIGKDAYLKPGSRETI